MFRKIIPALGNGNCAFNAAILGLLDLAHAKKFQKNNKSQNQILELFKETPSFKNNCDDWDTFIEKLSTFSTQQEFLVIQNEAAGILRKLVANFIQNNMQDYYAAHLITEIENAFLIYIGENKDNSVESIRYYTNSHPSIKKLFEESKDKSDSKTHLKNALKEMFITHNGKIFCEEIADSNQKTYKNHLALSVIMHLFDIKIIIQTNGASNYLVDHPWTPCQIADEGILNQLIAGKIIFKWHTSDYTYQVSKKDLPERLENTLNDNNKIPEVLADFEANVKNVKAVPELYVKHKSQHYDYLTDNEWLAFIYYQAPSDDKENFASNSHNKVVDIILPPSDLRKIYTQSLSERVKIYSTPALTDCCCTAFTYRQSKSVKVDFSDYRSVTKAHSILAEQDQKFKDRKARCELAITLTAVVNLAIVAILTGVKEYTISDRLNQNSNGTITNTTTSGNVTTTAIQTVTNTLSDKGTRGVDLTILIMAALAAFVIGVCKKLSSDATTDSEAIQKIQEEIRSQEKDIAKYITTVNTDERQQKTLEYVYKTQNPAEQFKELKGQLDMEQDSELDNSNTQQNKLSKKHSKETIKKSYLWGCYTRDAITENHPIGELEKPEINDDNSTGKRK